MNKDLFCSILYSWYEQNHRILPWRDTTNPYHIWISEIILQQTRVAQGMEYYLRFIKRFPDVDTLANSPEDEVLLYWQGLGYYSRARNLHKAAQYIVAQRKKWNVPFPTTWEQLRTLPGVGDYTAGAIASFAYNLPHPAMDGNVYRVLARLWDCDVVFDTSAGKRHFHSLANQMLDTVNPRLFNSAIMEFGALYCTPSSPDCPSCPLSTFCQAYAKHTVEMLPLRKPRPQLRDRFLNYAIYITSDGKTLIQQRQKKDIWRHLYEFILTESDSLTDDPTADKHIDFTHILSHQRLHARFNIYKVASLPNIENAICISIRQLDEYALSRLTLRALEALQTEK